MSNRMKTDYKELELDYLDAQDLLTIQVKAKALSLEECLEFICAEIEDIPKAEMRYATLAHRRGRSEGIATACDHLFGSMKMRNGGQAAVEYLRQMSGEFQIDAQATPGGTSGFSFNVHMPEAK